MKPSYIFRFLLALDLIIPVAVAILSSGMTPVPEAITAWLAENSTLDATLRKTMAHFPKTFISGGIVFLLAIIASYVGLWFYKRWARALFCAITALSLVLQLPPDPMLVYGPQMFGISLVWFILGATLTMSYLQPISSLFEKRT